jgi:hypothetical protein
MKRNRFPKGWDEARVRQVLEHYDSQTDEEAIAEDEAAFRMRDHAVMIVPKKLVPAITKLITRSKPAPTRSSRKKSVTKPTLRSTS